jgi:hypothetical protein
MRIARESRKRSCGVKRRGRLAWGKLEGMRKRLLGIATGALCALAFALPQSAASAVIFKGTFGPAGTHTGRGKVTVVAAKGGARYLKLSSDFRAYNAVRLSLYLATNASATRIKNLGSMRTTGAQRFLVPRGVNLTKYKYVIAWCVDFDVPITDAILSAA